MTLIINWLYAVIRLMDFEKCWQKVLYSKSTNIDVSFSISNCIVSVANFVQTRDWYINRNWSCPISGKDISFFLRIFIYTSFPFYGLFHSELLRIGRWKEISSNFIPQVSEHYHRIVAQEGNAKQLQKQTEKCWRNILWF